MLVKPGVIDLFSGCGGLLLGFEKAGFELIGGVEISPEALDTLNSNFCWRYGKDEVHICGDITEIDADVFKSHIGKEGCIIIGGPPCQAYSLIGRAKLQSLGDDRKNTNDGRGLLYQEFLRFVKDLCPRAVVMENVPESVNYGGKNIPETVCTELEQMGYRTFWTILNSADFGVPQIRERIFVLAVRQDEQRFVELPVPDHKNPGQDQTNYQKQLNRFSAFSHFRQGLLPDNSCENWVTVGEALSDLPVLFTDPFQKYQLIPINAAFKYQTEPENEFQQEMRTWYGEETQFVTGESFRKTVRDFPLFAKMKQGDNYLQASEIALQRLQQEAEVAGISAGSQEYQKLKKKIVPPYKTDKFFDKWKKLDEDKPSHTLVAHLSVDTYSHIHPWEPRGISVREAARLQSFPDDFYFQCRMGDAYKQIGNAVPPLLAYAVGKSIASVFMEDD